MDKVCNSYWHWNNIIPQEICQKIIGLSENRWKEAEIVGSVDEEPSLENVRESSTVWLTEEWLHELLIPFFHTANNSAGWKYDISAAENMQLTRYMENGFYKWHFDGMGCHNSIIDLPDTAIHGKTRKLSLTVILNSDFEGGQFEFFDIEPKGQPKMDIGSIVVFPSWQYHRVTAVTKGIRYSLVAWAVGPPFL